MTVSTPPPPVTQIPPKPPASQLRLLANGALGGAVGAAGLLLAVFTNRPAVILPWCLVVVGLLAVVPMLNTPHWMRILTTSLITVGLVAAGIAVYFNPHLLVHTRLDVKTAYATPPPPPIPTITLDAPKLGDATPVPGCYTIKFQATPPDGWSFAIGNRKAGDDRTFFEGNVAQDPTTDEWSATITMGDTTDGMGDTFELSIIMMPLPLLAYLTDSRPEADATWWTGKKNPPDSIQALHFTVTRNKNAAMGC